MTVSRGKRIRHGVSLIGKMGLRVLMSQQTLCDTRGEAEQWLAACIENTGEDRLVQIHGEQSRGTFRVDPFECWANGDPCGIYVLDKGRTDEATEP